MYYLGKFCFVWNIGSIFENVTWEEFSWEFWEYFLKILVGKNLSWENFVAHIL